MKLMYLIPLLSGLACTENNKPTEPTDSGDTDDSGSTVEPMEPTEYSMMETAEAITRVSMAIRGVPPSGEEIQQVLNDPSQLVTLARSYTDSPLFGQTIRDMYAEILLMRSGFGLPELGPLSSSTRYEVAAAIAEEPLALIEYVVRNDMPFTEIVTANWSVLNEVSSLMWDNHDYDQSTGGEQKVQWTDGRPQSGIISSNGMLIRHPSNGANYHRGRANVLSDSLLCASFSGRDIPLNGDIDLSDDNAVAYAVQYQPECVACHQSLDPLAGHYWVFRNRLSPFQIVTAYNGGNGGIPCDESLPASFSCYPVKMYSETLANSWLSLDLREPNYWGSATTDTTDMSQQIADDPRFSLCAAWRFNSYLTQRPMNDIPFEEVAALQAKFIDSGFDAKQLAVDIVTSDPFLAYDAKPESAADTLPGLQIIRPEQLHRTIQTLTGFEWAYDVPISNYGQFPTLYDDNIGFRAMSGGINGGTISAPTHTTTPIKLLTMATYAEDAAGYVVDNDFMLPVNQRKLLDLVEPSDTNESLIREQIGNLHSKIFGMQVEPDAEDVDMAFELFELVYADGGSNRDAWKALIAAMLQSPDILYY